MSRKKANNPVTEEMGTLAVRGAVYPDGSGQAVSAQLVLGDGLPPTIVIRFGTEDDGGTVAEVTAGGFVSRGNLRDDLRSVGEILATIADVLTNEASVQVPEHVDGE